MLVEVLKTNYLVVLSESEKDTKWLEHAGYMKLGEDYYQEIFSNLKELIEELTYLLDYPARFADRESNDSPQQFLADLKAENLI